MKILFTDLDGTLLTDDKRILDADMAAIHAMIEAGHKFVMTTGRPLFSVKRLAEKYGFLQPGFFLVSFNGGLVYDCGTNEPILTRRISVDEVKYIMDEAHAHGMHAHTYAGDLVVSEYETEQLKNYCRTMQMDYVVVDDIRKYFSMENGAPINVVVKPPIKVNVITPFEHSGLVEFRAEMRKTTEGKLFDVFSKPEMLEFSHMKSNKGDAVRFMADFYKVPIADTIAVGDEENDCPMIEAAGVGVAMANASEVAKMCADYVTVRDNNHAGISEVIEKFVL
ncbi:MAG: Cof-type HAD-IIB family hydrolase [Fibrobacter sp.]|nr:Cof-type HAD-IIB family hydrolase [Fibrobacter sp.]